MTADEILDSAVSSPQQADGTGAVFGLNMDGSVDGTDVGRMSDYNAHHGAYNDTDLTNPKLAGLAIGGHQAVALTGISDPEAARQSLMGKFLHVTNHDNGQSAFVQVVDKAPIGQPHVEMTPAAHELVGSNGKSNLGLQRASADDFLNSAKPSADAFLDSVDRTNHPDNGLSDFQRGSNLVGGLEGTDAFQLSPSGRADLVPKAVQVASNARFGSDVGVDPNAPVSAATPQIQPQSVRPSFLPQSASQIDAADAKTAPAALAPYVAPALDKIQSALDYSGVSAVGSQLKNSFDNILEPLQPSAEHIRQFIGAAGNQFGGAGIESLLPQKAQVASQGLADSLSSQAHELASPQSIEILGSMMLLPEVGVGGIMNKAISLGFGAQSAAGMTQALLAARNEKDPQKFWALVGDAVGQGAVATLATAHGLRGGAAEATSDTPLSQPVNSTLAGKAPERSPDSALGSQPTPADVIPAQSPETSGARVVTAADVNRVTVQPDAPLPVPADAAAPSSDVISAAALSQDFIGPRKTQLDRILDGVDKHGEITLGLDRPLSREEISKVSNAAADRGISAAYDGHGFLFRKSADAAAPLPETMPAAAETQPGEVWYQGNKVALTTDPAPDGFVSFTYLDGHKAGQNGVMRTPEARASDIAAKNKQFQDQQEAFRRLRESGKSDQMPMTSRDTQSDEGGAPPLHPENSYFQKNLELRARILAQGFRFANGEWVHPDYPGKSVFSEDVPDPKASDIRSIYQTLKEKYANPPATEPPIAATTEAPAEQISPPAEVTPADAAPQDAVPQRAEQASRPVPKVPEEPPVEPVKAPEPSDPVVSRIANRFTHQRSTDGELGEIAPGQGYSTQDLTMRGLKMGPEEIAQHVSDLMQDTHGDVIKQASAVRAQEALLSDRAHQTGKAAQENPTDMAAKKLADETFQELTDFHNGPVAKIKERFHATGMALQGEMPVDLGNVNGLKEAWLKENGKAPPPKMEPVMRKMAERVTRYRSEDSVAMKRLGAAIDKEVRGKKLPSYEDVRNRIVERMKEGPCRV